tara:strand:+ start:348 stop:1130 length:783 start_codon:yes stop_codon:yes gene_type:complete
MSQPKILIFDIETAPNLAHVWGLWDNNVGLNQLMAEGYILSYAAKWLGKPKIFYAENRTDNDKKLVESLCKLLDEADIIVGHNGKRFDLNWVRGSAAAHGLPPFSPVKVVDTLLETRKIFKYPSYKLEYLLKKFGCTHKEMHKNFIGHTLWTECLAGNPKAWKEMKAYNIVDVTALEELYLKLRGWISHPNMGAFIESAVPVCSKCGTDKLSKDGYYRTNTGKFQQYRCKDKGCGGWARSRTTVYDKDKRGSLLASVSLS